MTAQNQNFGIIFCSSCFLTPVFNTAKNAYWFNLEMETPVSNLHLTTSRSYHLSSSLCYLFYINYSHLFLTSLHALFLCVNCSHGPYNDLLKAEF